MTTHSHIMAPIHIECLYVAFLCDFPLSTSLITGTAGTQLLIYE